MVGLLTGVSSVTTLLGQLVFGRITDKKGDVFVQVADRACSFPSCRYRGSS